jgi:hypothetical protein
MFFGAHSLKSIWYVVLPCTVKLFKSYLHLAASILIGYTICICFACQYLTHVCLPCPLPIYLSSAFPLSHLHSFYRGAGSGKSLKDTQQTWKNPPPTWNMQRALGFQHDNTVCVRARLRTQSVVFYVIYPQCRAYQFALPHLPRVGGPLFTPPPQRSTRGVNGPPQRWG